MFPKCYFDALCRGEMDYVSWIRSAAALDAEGLEHYDGFLRSFSAADVDPIVAAMRETGQVSSMLCFSPDFTHPDADERGENKNRRDGDPPSTSSRRFAKSHICRALPCPSG